MGTFLRNTISKLCHPVSAPVTATRDALAKRLESIHETACSLYNKMMENMEYGRQRLKDIIKKEAEEEEAKEQQQEETAKEQQQDDNEQYDTVAKLRMVYKGKRVKEFGVTGNLSKSNTKMIQHIANITPQIQMWTKIIYLFKSEIHQGAGDIVPYYKTLTSPPGMFISLEEIQAYIEDCE